jgi:aminopeptidase N
MRSWRSLERTRRENARASLAGIAAERGISTDTREIVERILA